MAQMIPRFGPAPTESYAEPKIYEILKKQLSGDFVVIHSLPWLLAATEEIGGRFTAPTGEIDFVVLHPDLGILAVEIKGGKYRIDGSAFVLIKTGKPSFVIDQTRKNAHSVARWIGGKTSIRWRIGYAMFFPDSFFPTDELPPGVFDSVANKRITLDYSDLPTLGVRITKLMQFWKTALDQPSLDISRMSTIVRELCPDFDGTPAWSHRIYYDNNFWLKLNEEQNFVADRVLRMRRGVITGWPGTGKTLVGTEIARRFSAEGQRVLFITFNSLLSQHIKSQLVGTNCRVQTWHKLCSYSLVKTEEATRSTNWYEQTCLEDLKLSNNGRSRDFDVLIVDEAQALRPLWWEYLATWFSNQPIFAFCDATQVFSFERETTSLETLCRTVGVSEALQLSVVMRMPRAVTNRLIDVMPSHIHITSPRNLEPDSINEIVVEDWTSTLTTLFSRFKESGVKDNEIVVLGKTGYLTQEVQEFFDTLGDLKIFPVAQFRGMESPIVVIIDAHELSEAELFSAYSRATTACYALYNAASIPDSPENGFLAALWRLPENQATIGEAKYKRSVSCQLKSHNMSKVNAITSANITWSRTLNSWLIEVSREAPISLWVDYLRENFPWPVLYTYYEEPDSLRLATPKGSESIDGWVRLLNCDICKLKVPHRGVVRECMLCNGIFGVKDSVLTMGVVNQLSIYDQKIKSCLMMDTQSNLFEYYKNLPFLLGAAALGTWVMNSPFGTGKPIIHLPDGSSAYRAAVVLAQAKALLSGPNFSFDLRNLVSSTIHSDFEIIELSEKKWHIHLANALSRLYQQGILKKISKGKYCLSEVQDDLCAKKSPDKIY
jgi:hypothetical protein